MMNNTTITISIALVCLALFLGGAYGVWMILTPTDVIEEPTLAPVQAVPEAPMPRPTEQPGSVKPINPSQTNSASTSISISGYSGATLLVRNFLNDADVVKLTSAGASIYTIGSLPQDESLIGTTSVALPTARDRGYEILFSESEGTFLVYLMKEPLGTQRRLVADDLQRRLGIGLSELCTVQVAVIVTAPHPTLRGKYIGLPECAGSLRLPE